MAYKGQNTHIDIFFLYTGNKEVESVHKLTHPLDEHALLKRNDVAHIVRTHQYLNSTKYKLISLLRYNITLDTEEIEHENDYSRFLYKENHIDDMHFADTLNCLQETNALFLIFSRDYKTRDKRETKRIIFNDKLRKTKRGWKKT